MKSKNVKYILSVSRLKLFLLILLGSVVMAYSQQAGLTESDLIANAQSLFDKKDYQAAMPLYAQLVSVHPDDPLFNYRFGVCTLYGDRKDKKKPIKYLNNAAQTLKDDPELNYFLGLAYHQNQEFANAMKYFNLYLAKLPANAPERASVLEKVNACLNGLNLADKNLVAEIVSTSKFQKDNFHRAYAPQDFNGSLMIKPEIFVSEKERKSGENSYVYLIHPSNFIYFSGFTSGENSNRDIFKAEMDENGDWGIPEKADESINTSFDENFPVLVDNGNTLYFCSKGHNSLGGYDIFRSTLDPNTNKFTQPENLGPGINSPFDDIVFIPTKDKAYVYFASDRDNLNGSINVYKVRLVDNPFSDELILADKKNEDIYQPSGQSKGSNNYAGNSESNSTSEIALQQNSVNEPVSDPSKKATSILNDRSKSTALADSAFAIITNTKNLIRDLTNKRDRANAISQRKADEAKTLEIRFNESVAQLANATSEDQFLQDLEKSVEFKEEVYQLQQRSSQANKIAWNLGNQVKIKNQELNNLKTLASKIQTTSVTGTFEETLVLFTNYKKIVTATDTLADYSDPLVAITNNKTTFEVPASELVFAENLKKAYQNHTLLAEMNSTKPAFDDKIPIVVVDKRTNIQQSASNIKSEEKPLEALALVHPVVYSSANFTSVDPGKEVIVLDFKIDNRTEPLALVESINFRPAINKTADLENPEIEINFNVDKLAVSEIYALVEPVYSNVPDSFTEPTESDLTLNFDIDAVKPVKQVEIVNNATMENNYQFTEEIEISNFTDKAELPIIAELVEPVTAKGLIVNNVPDTPTLELDFAIDEVKADQLIQPVEAKVLVLHKVNIDEEIEIGSFTDKAEQSSIAAIVEPVNSIGLMANNMPEISTLELNFAIDEVEADKLIHPVEANVLAQNQVNIDEEIEISSLVETVDQEPIAAIVQPVYLNNQSHINESYNADLEIKFGVDQLNETKKVVEQVPMVLLAQDIVKTEENLEIRNLTGENNSMMVARMVEPIAFHTSPSVLAFIDENLEINYDADGMIASKLAEPINYKINNTLDLIVAEPEIDFTADKMNILDIPAPAELITYIPEETNVTAENIEISFAIDREILVASDVLQVVAYNEPSSDILQIDPSIEIDFAIDQPTEIYAVIDPVHISSNQINSVTTDEEVEISFIIDILPEIIIHPIKAKTIQSSEIALNNPESESMDQKLNNIRVTSADEIYFLRESVIKPDGIESSKSDDEILAKALKNPDDLSYEELIYAANLTDVQEEKIAIYNVAFIHIDRDWRAFNNAAVSAIHLEDLSKANCYLYQASLLSSNNGHIRNNMGILACHLYQFDKAEKYFVAASNLGYDAQYNLKLAHGLSDLIASGRATGQEKVKNASEGADVIVDIIDYNTSGE